MNIGEIIGVVELKVEKKGDGRLCGEKGIAILAGLINEKAITAANEAVLAYIRSAKHGWRKIGEKMREHRCDRALAVRACDSYRGGVLCGEHTEKPRSADDRLSARGGKGALGIIFGNGEGIHTEGVGRYSLGLVALPELDSLRQRERRLSSVACADAIAAICEQSGKRQHTCAKAADEVNGMLGGQSPAFRCIRHNDLLFALILPNSNAFVSLFKNCTKKVNEKTA